ncbi:hypothetical protein SPFL3102_00965 [Sporomusaceae bacterium FL31]|nr:hypothetical protein SPFL3101_03016 [Sporomusaceae bacterium FL31]GCE33164.1 hypothetical protein SPFL3102_00965 [Sporomusaceae bacterium]
MRELAIVITVINMLFFFIAPIFLSLFGVKNSFMTYFFTVILYSGGIGIAPFALHVLIIVMNTVISWNLYNSEHKAKPCLILSLVGLILNIVVFLILMKVLQ